MADPYDDPSENESGSAYGTMHPLDQQRLRARVGQESRYNRMRDSLHEQLEKRANALDKVPLQALDIFTDYLFYTEHMLKEAMATVIAPQDAVGHIRAQAQVEQVRGLGEEIAAMAAQRRIDAAKAKGEG